MSNKVIEWAEANPAMAGIGVVVVGLGLLYVMGGLGGGGGSNSGAAAYYAAQSAEAQSGNALQAVQIQANATTAQMQIAADTSVANNTTWASTSVTNIAANNSAAIALAPYQLQNNLIDELGNIASKPGAVVTNTSSSKGFFGIGGGSKTTSTYTPDPAAVHASDLLSQLITNGLYPHS